jgi:retron-type reverse transcriptase
MKPDTWPTFEEVTQAYRECRLGKRASVHQARFEAHLGKNLFELHQELITEKYRPSSVVCFVVTRPKPREIFAAHFRDRVVHHLVVSQLATHWERKFIHSSFACRKGKGTHGALKYFQKQVRQISQGGIRPVYALKLDLASFFATIHRPSLCQLLTNDLSPRNNHLRHLIQTLYLTDGRRDVIMKGDQRFFDLIPPEKSWFHQGKDHGIPIGNLISQFGANVYLTELDHLIQRKLKPRAYLRYMDDLLLLDINPEHLRPFEKVIGDWLLQHRRQSLNSAKTVLTRLDRGIEYLGYHCIQTDTPKEPLQLFLPPKKKWEWIQSLRELERINFQSIQKPHPLASQIESEQAQKALSQINSRLGHLKHAETFRLRKSSIDQVVLNLSACPGLPRELGEAWSPLKARRDYQAVRRR